MVLASKNERHPATSELTLNGVGSAESGKQTFGDRGHDGEEASARFSAFLGLGSVLAEC